MKQNTQLDTAAFRLLARQISLVENESKGYQDILKSLDFEGASPIIGITGPPGAGKSTLLNALLENLVANSSVAILAVDPTSPFNYGALLGDRIRLSQFYNHPNVFIRSVATRGSLGGLSDKIIEISDVVRAFSKGIFDYVFVETVGVGQSEVEIAGLADTTIVTLVPEAGDEIQTMKAGLMEIADLFVVNKSDRAEADRFVQNLRKLSHSRMGSSNQANQNWETPVIKTVATKGEGITELLQKVQAHQNLQSDNFKKPYLLTEKILKIIQKKRMHDIDRTALLKEVKSTLNQTNHSSFNVYQFAERFF